MTSMSLIVVVPLTHHYAIPRITKVQQQPKESEAQQGAGIIYVLDVQDI